MEPKCDECQALGKLCARAPDLYMDAFPPEILDRYLKK
jgi:hypothetical protein